MYEFEIPYSDDIFKKIYSKIEFTVSYFGIMKHYVKYSFNCCNYQSVVSRDISEKNDSPGKKIPKVFVNNPGTKKINYFLNIF